AAHAFADRIGAPLVASGHRRWLIRGRDVLPIAALFEEARGIEAVEPLRPGEEIRMDARDEDDDAVPAIIAAEAASARSLEDLQREAAQIERDLSIRIALEGPRVISAGEAVPLRAELVNRGWGQRWIVRPGDGSEVA